MIKKKSVVISPLAKSYNSLLSETEKSRPSSFKKPRGVEEELRFCLERDLQDLNQNSFSRIDYNTI